ncbi:hypothetical protein [Catellatospora sp. NPDC049609]|uniref:hypothetical protein n=1 Tax=Catellatospora sp. NPDC049609 TaxID=3155505 RepID=UPI00341BBF8B
MRRLLAATALAVTLFGLSACADQSADPSASGSSPAATAAASVAPSASAGTDAKAVCAEFDKIFQGQATTNLGVAIGELLVARQGKDATKIAAAETKVKGELAKLQTGIADLSAKATDPAVKAKFDEVAANVGKAADLAFLEGTTKVEELEAKLTPAFLSWIMPLATTCA